MLHKPGKPKSEITSYHPFSLTSCLGKILEKNITNRVKDWCNKNNIINKQQNGFRTKRSTNDNPFKLTQSLKQNTSIAISWCRKSLWSSMACQSSSQNEEYRNGPKSFKMDQ